MFRTSATKFGIAIKCMNKFHVVSVGGVMSALFYCFILSLTLSTVQTGTNCSRKFPISEHDVGVVLKEKTRNPTAVYLNYWDRPIRNGTQPIIVKIGIAIRSLVSIDESARTVILRGGFFIEWQDEYRIWNDTNELSCIKSLVISHGKGTGLWVPFLRSADQLVSNKNP